MEEKLLIKDTFAGTEVLVKPLSQGLVRADEVLDHNKLLESVSKISKGNGSVLGVLEGVYFLPDGYSRNKRFYPRELWEQVVQKMTPVFQSKGVLGTLEHPESNEDAHPKNASHVVKKIWIGKDGKGYGKSYLLNTPIGSLVYILGSALDEEGKPLVPLFMSSRGLGRVSGYTQDGYEVVDPSTYILETFDVVLDPGFVEAKPTLRGLVESVLPEVEEMGKSGESFFFSLPENLSLEEGEEPEPAPSRPEGFLEEAYPILEASQVVLPYEGREVQIGEVPREALKSKGKMEEEKVEPYTAVQAVPLEGELSQEDLASFVRTVESVEYQRQERPENREGENRGPQVDGDEVSLLLAKIRSLSSSLEALRSEVEGIKVALLEGEYGLAEGVARKVLESYGGNLHKAREAMRKKSLGEGKKAKKKERISDIPIQEARTGNEEEGDFGLLRSIYERIG